MNLKKEKRNKKIYFYFYIVSKILSFLVNLLIIISIIIFLYRFNNNTLSIVNEENELSWVEKHLIKNEKNTLEDVQGYEDIKIEMNKLVEFAEGKRDESTIERGILLYGPPGTGKTFLAKALAGSVQKNNVADFYYFSASSFQEKYVGVGAARIRSVFELAKKKSKKNQQKAYFIFVDEIDALGRDRVLDDTSKNDSVLNELLVQLDGFNDNNNPNEPKAIFIASTNRETLLDEALTRSGRLGKKIKVDFPDKNMIKKIIEYFIIKDDLLQSIFNQFKKINEQDYEQKIKDLSSFMFKFKFTPAKIKSLFKNFKDLLSQENITINESITFDKIIGKIYESIDAIILGPKNSISASDNNKEDKEILIIHELGHAFFALINEHKVQRISLEQRGSVQGYTINVPEKENILKNKTDFLQEIKIALGGRVFEEIFNGSQNVTLGSTNDFQQAYQIAYSMVTDLGMSINIEERKKLQQNIQNISQEKTDSELDLVSSLSDVFAKTFKLYGCQDIQNIVLYNKKNYDSNIVRSSVENIIVFCYCQNIVDFYNHYNHIDFSSKKILEQQTINEIKKKILDQTTTSSSSSKNLSEDQIKKILSDAKLSLEKK